MIGAVIAVTAAYLLSVLAIAGLCGLNDRVAPTPSLQGATRLRAVPSIVHGSRSGTARTPNEQEPPTRDLH